MTLSSCCIKKYVRFLTREHLFFKYIFPFTFFYKNKKKIVTFYLPFRLIVKSIWASRIATQFEICFGSAS